MKKPDRVKTKPRLLLREPKKKLSLEKINRQRLDNSLERNGHKTCLFTSRMVVSSSKKLRIWRRASLIPSPTLNPTPIPTPTLIPMMNDLCDRQYIFKDERFE